MGGGAVSRGPGPQAGALPEVPPALPGSLLPPHPSPNLSQKKKGEKGQRKRFSSPLSENEILKITKRRCSTRRGLCGEPGCGGLPAPPPRRVPCPQPAACAHITLSLAPSLCPSLCAVGGRRGRGELLRREVTVEMEEAETLGSGPQAAGGPHCPSAPLPRLTVQQLPGPSGQFLISGVLALAATGCLQGRSSAPPSLPPPDVPSRLSVSECHFSRRLTLATGWSPGVTPTVATTGP